MTDVALHGGLFAAIGCKSYAAIARETGVDERTVRRARLGQHLGVPFIAQTLAALNRHADTLRAQGLEPPTFDDLFQVVVPQEV
jgi:hypothetical protein